MDHLCKTFQNSFNQWTEGKTWECFLCPRFCAELFIFVYNFFFSKIVTIYGEFNWVLPPLNWTLPMNEYGAI